MPGNGDIADGLAPLPGGPIAVAATNRGPAPPGSSDFGAIALNRPGRLDRGFAAAGSCHVPLAGKQSAAGIVDTGGRAVSWAATAN